MSVAQHIMLRLVDDRVIAATKDARRLVARSVLRIGRSFGLLAFRSADSHIHNQAACSAREAGELARRIELSLGRLLALPVGFERARIKPVRDQRHAMNLFDYVFRQEERHGTELDPLFTASNLPDLLGIRLTGAYTRANVAARLPRVSDDQLAGYLGLASSEAPIRLDDLADCAATAFALRDLRGRPREATAARRAAIAAVAGRATTAELAELLGVSARAVSLLRRGPVRQEAVRAVRLQLLIRASFREREDERPTWADAPFGDAGPRL